MNRRKLTGPLVIFIFVLWLLMPVEEENTRTTAELPTDQWPGLVYACPDSWDTLDPALAKESTAAFIITNLYEGLVKWDAVQNEIKPCLAKTWEVSPDGLEWTFKLRRGVRFHDGTVCNAQAVKFSYERQLQLDDHELIYSRFVFGPVKKLEVLDDYTVKFTLHYPYAPLLKNLAMPFAAPVVSPAAVKRYGPDFWRYPAGTGPFMLDEIKGNLVILQRNSQHWNGTPPLDYITVLPVPETEKRIKLLQEKKVHLATGIPPQKAGLLKAKGYQTTQVVGLDISYLGFYLNKPPFSDPKARQAVNLAIDRVKLIRETLDGQGAPATTFLPPALLAKPHPSLPYDPQKAGALITSARVGSTITLITYKGQRPYNPAGGTQLARDLSAQLEEIGLKVKIKAYPWQAYKQALARQEGDAFLYGWISDNCDPDNFLFPSFATAHIETGLNISHFSEPRVDTLLASARLTASKELRHELYTEALQILEREVPWAVLNHSLTVTASVPSLTGYAPHPLGWDDLSKVNF